MQVVKRSLTLKTSQKKETHTEGCHPPIKTSKNHLLNKDKLNPTKSFTLRPSSFLDFTNIIHKFFKDSSQDAQSQAFSKST